MALTKISDTGVKASNAPSNGKFLQYKDGTDKLTWADVDLTNFNTDVTFTGDSANIVWDKSENALEFADNATALFGTGGDLNITHYSSGSLSRIHNSGAGGLDIKSTSGNITFKSESGGSEQTGGTYTPGAGWAFYHAGGARIATDGSGVDITGQLDVDGHVNLGDSDYLQLGDSNDLQLGNNGTNNFIQASNSLLSIATASDHAVQIKHNDSTKLATSSTGVTVTGTVTATSFSGSGANLTNLPPAGNTVDLVADGAIAAGKPVIVTTAGKAKAIGLESTNRTNPSIDHYSKVSGNDTGYQMSGIWHETSGKGVLLYRKISGGNSTQYAQFKLNTSGDITAISNDRGIDSYWAQDTKLIMDPDIDKPIAFWKKGSDDQYVYSRSITIDGNGTDDPQASTQGASTPRSIAMVDNKWDVCYDTNANVFVYVYTDSSDSGKGKVRLGYQTEPATGQHKITWINTDVQFSSDCESPRCTFDTVNNKVIIAWGQAGADVSACIGTVSNSGSSATISVGTAVVVNSVGPGSSGKPHMAWHTNDGVAGYFYRRSDNNENHLIILKTSGTTVHYNSSVKVGTENVDEMALWYVSSLKTFQCAVKGRVAHWISSTGTPTSGGSGSSAATVGSGAGNLSNDIGGNINDWEPTKGFDLPDHPLKTGMTSSNGTDSNRLYLITYTVGTEVTNATASNVIGFAENAINDTATGTIKLTGNVVGNQSGLTPGTAYYVQGNGTLGTSQDNTIGAASGKTKAGVALSATTLKIADYA